MLLKGEGMLEPSAPTGLDKLSPKFRDKDYPPAWTGMDAWIATICYITVEARKNNLPMPASWSSSQAKIRYLCERPVQRPKREN